ncbi:MAG: YceD family protein [Caldisericum sp.]
MKLQIDRIIDEGNIEIIEEIDFTDIEMPVKIIGPVKVHLNFENLGQREIRVTGEIFATLRLTCVVCLEEFDEKLKIEVDETYIPETLVENKKEERPIEELSEFTYKASYLDTFEIVRDNILEFIPPYPKCPKCLSKTEEI